MTDFFALLHEPRRPGLDASRLRDKFLALASECHPDRVHNASAAEKAAANRHYAELNAAVQCLTDPKTRLLHLLELERGSRPPEIQTIPPALADWFVGIAAICREADAFLLEREKVTSPLLKIQWVERAQAWIERLQEWQQNLGGLRGELPIQLVQFAFVDAQLLLAAAAAQRRRHRRGGGAGAQARRRRCRRGHGRDGGRGLQQLLLELELAQLVLAQLQLVEIAFFRLRDGCFFVPTFILNHIFLLLYKVFVIYRCLALVMTLA